MDLAAFNQKVAAWKAEFKSVVLPSVEKQLGKTLLQHFTDNFKAGGYEKGTSFVPWAKRKYSYQHKPLQKTGKLLKGFRLVQKGNQIQIVNDVPYASFINDGTPELTARPLLYDSTKINKEIESVITKKLLALFSL